MHLAAHKYLLNHCKRKSSARASYPACYYLISFHFISSFFPLVSLYLGSCSICGLIFYLPTCRLPHAVYEAVHIGMYLSASESPDFCLVIQVLFKSVYDLKYMCIYGHRFYVSSERHGTALVNNISYMSIHMHTCTGIPALKGYYGKYLA